MKRQYKYMIAAGAALLLTACASDLSEQTALTAADGRIHFEATVAAPATRAVTTGHMSAQPLSGYKSKLWLIPSVTDTEAAATRGTQLTSASTLAAFGVSAYKHSNLVDITNAKPDYFYNKRVTKDDVTGKYGFAQDYYWPSNDEYLSFYAYYPYNSMSNPSAEDDNTLVSLTASTLAGPQKVTVTISDDVTQQVDFMTATALNQTPAKTTAGPPAAEPAVALAFQHQLCGIRFKIGDQFPTKGYIQKITLKNVYKQGTYTIGAEAATAWDYGERDDFEVSYSIDRAVTTPGDDVTNESETFLMIPYTFPAENSGASMEIQFWAGDQTYTVTASLDGHVWEAGKTVTYELSSQNLTTLKIQSIGYYQYADATVNNAVPVKAWADGDQVGLYVVQGYDADGNADGRTLRYTNIPCTYNGTTGKWTIDHTTAQGQVIKYPGDSYYFYYPYAEGGPAGYPNECNEVGASAETFFASVITARATNKANYADQSDIASFKLADLQVAKGVTPEENDDLPASTISASMSRQVGLARLQLDAPADIPVTKYYLNNSVDQTKTTASGTASRTATDKFLTNIPCGSGGIYYFFTPSNTSVTLNSIQTDDNKWTSSHEYTIAAGAASDIWTAYSVRHDWDFVNAVWNYSYTGNNCYTWTAPLDASYTMECWGAQGGNGVCNGSAYDGETSHGGAGGKGGYAKGDINLTVPTSLSVYVGGKGADANYILGKGGGGDAAGGWNGGGKGIFDDQDDDAGGGGGGATDIRIIDGSWDSFASLRSRIMVAGGGGGSSYNVWGGSGGGLEGSYPTQWTEDTEQWESVTSYSYAKGTQTSGYKFGIGEDASHRGVANTDVAGAGGGYYGGKTPATLIDTGNSVGGCGGSGFVSGMTGCNAIAESSTSSNITHTDSPNHYSGLVFTNTQMIDGGHTQPKPIGGTETGHSGNGYARITLTRW